MNKYEGIVLGVLFFGLTFIMMVFSGCSGRNCMTRNELIKVMGEIDQRDEYGNKKEMELVSKSYIDNLHMENAALRSANELLIKLNKK